jgi:hypothetical protein
VKQYPETAEKGPDPFDPRVRRKNVITAFVVLAVVAVVISIPPLLRRVQQPASIYPTYAAAAPAVQRGDIPTFVPATATDIHTRSNRNSGQRFVRFDFQKAEAPAITRGMKRITSEAELERVEVPSPGWSKWWLISSRTLTGGQAEYLEIYEVPSGPDRGYLALDPRTLHGYYWSR